MSWPFVSRLAFEILEESRNREREVNAMLRNQVVDLTAKYHQLRLMHHSLPDAPMPVPDPPKPDPVARAIAEAAGGNAELAASMRRQATVDAMSGKSADDIVRAIFQGVELDEGSPI